LEKLIPLNPMTVLNLIVALSIIALGLYYFIRGRKVDRWMVLSNLLAGVWAATTIIVIIIDRTYKDIFVEHTTRWLISVTLFVLLCTKLGNLIRIGRKDNG